MTNFVGAGVLLMTETLWMRNSVCTRCRRAAVLRSKKNSSPGPDVSRMRRYQSCLDPVTKTVQNDLVHNDLVHRRYSICMEELADRAHPEAEQILLKPSHYQ